MRRRTMVLGVVLAVVAAAAHAATVLVYVEETGSAGTADAPRPFRDALLGGLFDRGHIVFDLGESTAGDIDWTSGASPTLEGIAAAGGAEMYAVSRVVIRLTTRAGGRPTAEVGADYFVIRLSAGSATAVAKGRVSATNRGREDEVDAVAVARSAASDTAASIAAATRIR